jgi:hypothetical protein
MKKSTKWAVSSGVGVVLAALVLASGAATAAPYQSRTTHESVVVTSIDRAHRTATLQNKDGETKTIDVPSDLRAFDSLKVGDHVDIDYFQSIAIAVLPAGSKPAVTGTGSVRRVVNGVGVSSRELTVTATIVAVDPRTDTITFRGPRDELMTVAVDDPSLQRRLPDLRVGQIVELTYTEATAASLGPSSPSSAWWGP